LAEIVGKQGSGPFPSLNSDLLIKVLEHLAKMPRPATRRQEAPWNGKPFRCKGKRG
jgi:hypothetical protein